jgi:hypothetical protein
MFEQGRGELNLIADGLDAGWELSGLKEKLEAV